MVGIIIEAIITGILTGGVYALMASGLTLVFGVMDIINIGQGALVILGAYLSYVLEQQLHIDLFLGLLITMPCLFLLGIVLEWLFIRPIKRDRTMLSILVTFGIALIIEGILNLLFSADYVQLHAWYVTASFRIGNFYLSYIYVFGFLLAVLLLGALYLLLYRTRFGRSMRAAMENRTAAELIGIDVEYVSMITFGIGISLAAAGGMAFGATNTFNAGSAYDLISRLLAIIIFGGMGSLTGALAASVGMLVIEDVTAVTWSPVWANTVFFLLLVLILVLRPQGLFGRREGRKQ
ncbi:branched-chain amino acid ABC transporter permease [Ktedonobacter racemifer]|uniref:Inner-membrane translocator n=1 Tax=Ktedonobacter racemifer DSM 44963 TaxID=485913 RepID=D6TBK4_KTERA|nr:branched-chain amino acid ABC transporter permease [Ktedonobacter racemifer]EFH87988.1 inner-membrane translocator [Ktedonobacter racemifer DSM 44963]